MTIRAYLNRRVRWVFSAMFSGFALGVAGSFIGVAQGQQPIMALFLPGLGVVCVASILAHYVVFRCPLCRGNLGPLIVHRPGLSIPERVRYCPFCGTWLDEDMVTQEETQSEEERI